jgi:hypothetical protein
MPEGSRIVKGALGASSASETGVESDISDLIKKYLEPGDIRPPDKRIEFMDAVFKGVNLIKKDPKRGTPRFSLHLPLEVRRLFKNNIPLHIHLKHEEGKLKAGEKYFLEKGGLLGGKDGYKIPGYGGYHLYRDVLRTKNDAFKLGSVPGDTKISDLVKFTYKPKRGGYLQLGFKTKTISTNVKFQEFYSLKISKGPLTFMLYNSFRDGGILKLSIDDISLNDANKIAVKNDMELPLGD